MGPRKNLSPDRIWTHHLPNTEWALHPLSNENSWRARSLNWVLGPMLVLHYFHIHLPSCNFTITHVSLFTTYSLLNPAGVRRHMSCKNSLKWPCSSWVLVAQLIQRSPSVREVMGSNPIGTQIFSRPHTRVTLFSHTFTELQFHGHHSFISVLKCIFPKRIIIVFTIIYY